MPGTFSHYERGRSDDLCRRPPLRDLELTITAAGAVARRPDGESHAVGVHARLKGSVRCDYFSILSSQTKIS